MKKIEKEKVIEMDSEEMIHLKRISEKEFQEITKGCGIKYSTRFRAGSLRRCSDMIR